MHYNDDRRLLLPVDASDVSIYELTYLADDVVIMLATVISMLALMHNCLTRFVMSFLHPVM